MNSASDSKYPCLLDRLLGPNARWSRHRAAIDAKSRLSQHPTPMTPADYREAVLRDLKWLLNSPQPLRPERCLIGGDPEEASPHDRDDTLRTPENPRGYFFPFVRQSVLNYGAVSLTGIHGQGLDTEECARELREVIINFEPRFIPETVQVEVVDDPKAGTLVFSVSAHLWALPHPEPVRFRSEFDLERGGCKIEPKS
jgi:type VI secretion system protein ImpF